MTEEEKQEYRERQERIRKKKQEEYLKSKEYYEKLESTKLKDFKDKPDAINEVRCCYLDSDMVVIEWDQPQSNNCPILRYHVYVSEQTVSTKLNLQD